MRLVLLTSQNNNVNFELVKQIINEISECQLDIYFCKTIRSKKVLVQRQIKNIKRNGLMWVPYRLTVAFSDIFKKNNGENSTPLLAKVIELRRVTLKIVPSYNSEELKKEIRDNQYDLGIVFGTGIIKKDLFSLPKKGMINIHQGLTQWYRGQPPVFWELYNDERETGITIHKVAEKLDCGDIIFQKREEILPDDTLENLERKLDQLVIENLPGIIKKILDDSISVIPVDLARGKTYTRPTLKEMYELKRRLKTRKRQA